MVTSVGTLLNDRLGRQGIEGAWIGAIVDRLRGDPLGTLVNLHDQFLEAALDRATDDFEREYLTEIAPYLGMPTPREVQRTLAPWIDPGYSPGPTSVDLAAGDPELGVIGKIFDGRRSAAARYERLLRNDPVTRELFELLIGGRIVEFGDEDGRFAVEAFADGQTTSSDPGSNILAHLAAMERAAMGLGVRGKPDQPYWSMLLGGLASAAGFHPAGPGWSWSDNTSPLGGRGFGSTNPHTRPGIINGTNPEYESEHLDECAKVLRDPSLSVEDKVALFIMLIMEKMDKDIKNQAEYINSLQQQQGRRPGTIHGQQGQQSGEGSGVWGQGGPYEWASGPYGSPLGGWGDRESSEPVGQDHGGSYTSKEEQKDSTIEIETLKLKRIVDKRGQMFDMLRQIIDRYNQSAKALIDTMGR